MLAIYDYLAQKGFSHDKQELNVSKYIKFCTDEIKFVFLNECDVLFTSTQAHFKSIRKRWAGHITQMSEKSNSYTILIGEPEGKKTLWGPTCKWKDNIKIGPTK